MMRDYIKFIVMMAIVWISSIIITLIAYGLDYGIIQ